MVASLIQLPEEVSGLPGMGMRKALLGHWGVEGAKTGATFVEDTCVLNRKFSSLYR